MPIKKRSKAPEGDTYAAEAATEEEVFEEEDADEQAPSSQSLQRGWGAAKKVADASKSKNDIAGHFKFSEEQQLIAFIEGAPIDSYNQHWLGNRDGQKSFRCAEDECPLCAAGDNPSARFTFSVLCFEDNDGEVDPVTKVMQVGIRALKQLQAIDEDPKRGGPLEGHFFSAYRTGKKQDTTHHFTAVKLRDVEEDWEIPQDAALDALKKAQDGPEPKIWIDKLDKLQEIASEMRKSA